jgi:hypothetical protein
MATGAEGSSDEAVRGTEPPVAASGRYKAAHHNSEHRMGRGGRTPGGAARSQTETAAAVLLVLRWDCSSIPAAAAHWLTAESPPARPRQLCHSQGPRTFTELHDLPRSRIQNVVYINGPCRKRPGNFFGEKARHSALQPFPGWKVWERATDTTRVSKGQPASLRCSGVTMRGSSAGNR